MCGLNSGEAGGGARSSGGRLPSEEAGGGRLDVPRGDVLTAIPVVPNLRYGDVFDTVV